MSFIHNNGAIHLSDYERPSKKYEKEVIRLIELLGEKFNEIEAISKELRYYALYLDWNNGKLNHTGVLDHLHYGTFIIREQYDDKLDLLFRYMKDFEKYKFAKLKPEVIKKIITEIDPKEDKIHKKNKFRSI